jgi:uncharacterized protein (TIGR02001 family)
MRHLLLATTAMAALSLARPAAAQIAIGQTGLTLGVTGTAASDYLFRGISQTRSRPAYQISSAELTHTSGFYVGGFLSNVRFLGTDARQEVDLFGGYRFTAAGFNLDVGGIWYTYPGYDRRGPGQFGLNYAEAQFKAAREIGPVNLLAQVNVSPNFFGSSGTGVYVEGGADWKTGVWDLTLGGRLSYQWIERNPRFGTPDYLWGSVTVSREFAVQNVGTLIVAAGYYNTSIARRDCAGGQDICEGRAFGSISFRF